MIAPAPTLVLPGRTARPAVAPPTVSPLPAVPPPPARPRFTLDGDQALEHHLARTCERIAAGLRGLIPANKLQAVLLGGGYGRGEGGVQRSAEGDRPYNDLEFYVFLRGNRHVNERRYGHALHVFGEILTPQAGMEVEFRISSLAELVASPVSMFSYDLVAGHRWLIGDEALLAGCAHHLTAEDIPLSEATRLMMNRCTGLLLAQERLARATFTPADADFIARNIAKAQLGAGDAVLTAFSQYHWSVRERFRRLQRLAQAERGGWIVDTAVHHGAGVDFKLHPTRTTATREELAALHRHVSGFCREVWLWLENRRLNGAFLSIGEYAESRRRKCPELVGTRNRLVNAKLFGAKAALGRGARWHPRERILTTLPLLLWEADALTFAPSLARIQRELRTRATDLRGIVAAYTEIWSRVN